MLKIILNGYLQYLKGNMFDFIEQGYEQVTLFYFYKIGKHRDIVNINIDYNYPGFPEWKEKKLVAGKVFVTGEFWQEYYKNNIPVQYNIRVYKERGKEYSERNIPLIFVGINV